MSDTLSFTEIDAQHVELLPARTVLSLMLTSGGGGNRGGGGAGGDGGSANAAAVNAGLGNLGGAQFNNAQAVAIGGAGGAGGAGNFAPVKVNICPAQYASYCR